MIRSLLHPFLAGQRLVEAWKSVIFCGNHVFADDFPWHDVGSKPVWDWDNTDGQKRRFFSTTDGNNPFPLILKYIKHPLRNLGLVGNFHIIGTIYGVFNIRAIGLEPAKHDQAWVTWSMILSHFQMFGSCPWFRFLDQSCEFHQLLYMMDILAEQARKRTLASLSPHS